MQHSERIFDGFVIRAADRDSFPAHAVGVAILAEKHAVPETLLDPRNLRRQMVNAGREEANGLSGKLSGPPAQRKKPAFRRPTLLISSFAKRHLMPLCLSPAIFEQRRPGDAVGEA